MGLDPLEVVASTADAAFATDEEGRIVIWNRAAERLLGQEAAWVLGRPCHEILCGADIFGNRYCSESCILQQMARRHEPLRRFELDIRTASGEALRVAFSAMVIQGPRASQFTLIHLIQKVNRGEDVDRLIGRILTGPPGAVLPPASEVAPESTGGSSTLSAREIEVLRLMADGTSTQEIADSLFISITTVRHHVQSILRKLGVHSKLEAVSLAFRSRLI